MAFEELDEIAQDQGFKNAEELHEMISSLKLNSVSVIEAFQEWKENDGSKEGLLKVKERDNTNTT